MQITDVRVRKVAKEGKLKAVVSITMDEEFVVHDIKVIEGEKGLFIAMPSKKALDGEYRDIAHPINSGTREKSSQRFSENMKKLWKRNLKRKCKRHNA
mgnify:FL=1